MNDRIIARGSDAYVALAIDSLTFEPLSEPERAPWQKLLVRNDRVETSALVDEVVVDGRTVSLDATGLVVRAPGRLRSTSPSCSSTSPRSW